MLLVYAAIRHELVLPGTKLTTKSDNLPDTILMSVTGKPQKIFFKTKFALSHKFLFERGQAKDPYDGCT